MFLNDKNIAEKNQNVILFEKKIVKKWTYCLKKPRYF